MSKNFHQFLGLLVILLFASGCVTFDLGGAPQAPVIESPSQPSINTETPSPTAAPPGLTEATIMNGKYLSPMLQAPVQLVEGEFSGIVDGVELNARIYPGIQFGDLNADGISDAAWLLSENTGGSGIFVSLMVVYSEGGQFRQAPGFPIDDRPVVHSMTIADGVVKLTGLVHGPNDPMVNPTTTINAEFSLFGGRLEKTRLSSAFSGGAEHAIFIESPVDGQEVSGSVRLQGAMPIAPFENNLLMLISDPVTGQLVHEGFMVNAPEMGAPAIFDSLIPLPDAAPGTELLVTLMEISMADGTPIAIDTVRVIVR